MSLETLKTLHEELQQWLQDENMDKEMQQQLATIDQQVNSLLLQLSNNSNPAIDSAQQATMMDTLQILETRFAAEHPAAEQLLNRLINHLSNMGI